MIKGTNEILAEKSYDDCFADLLKFLVIAEQEEEMYGFCTATMALESVRVIMGYDQEKFEKLKNIYNIYK
jgi:hypothetical protein